MMNILTEAERFSPCRRRSSGGELSNKVFHKETGEAVRRVLPQRQLAACRVNDDQPTLRDDATPAVSVCIADVSSSTLIFRHLPLPVCLPPSSSTRLSLPSHLVIELGIKTIKRVTVPSFQDSPKHVNLYRNSSLHAGKKKTTPHFVTMQQHNVCRIDVPCPPRSPPSCSTPPIRACLCYCT